MLKRSELNIRRAESVKLQLNTLMVVVVKAFLQAVFELIDVAESLA